MTDQLAGIRRILDEIIAPELREGYPSQVLRGVVKNLSMLESAWPAIQPFVEWDAAATRALLSGATELVDSDLRGRIQDRLAQPSEAVGELDPQVDDLRRLLAETIRQLSDREEAADMRNRIKEHLRERTRRYPFRMAIAAPTSAKSTDS